MSELPGLRVVRAANPSPMTLDGTRTFVVGRERRVVIDPGPADDAHLRAIEAALEGAVPAAILLTHAHPDHSAGAALLASRLAAPLCMARGALQLPFPEAAVGRWLDDGAELETDHGTVAAVATPGHAPEHLCFWWTGPAAPPGGALFVGDLFMGEGDTTLVAAPEGELDAYLRSLERVAELAPGILFPAHGPPLPDPAAAVRRYREHREQRIRQVKAVLSRSPDASAEALVEQIYGAELHPALRRAAAASLRAVMEYLRPSH